MSMYQQLYMLVDPVLRQFYHSNQTLWQIQRLL